MSDSVVTITAINNLFSGFATGISNTFPASAIVNAVWDLWAKREGKPLYLLLADLAPERIVAAIDFRYIEDALSPDEALDLLDHARLGRSDRRATIAESGYPAYTTSAGWLGYSDEKIGALVREALAALHVHGLEAPTSIRRECRRRPAQRPRAGNEPRFGEHLRAVADAEHELSGLRGLNHRIHHRVVRSDGAGANTILVREPARQHIRIETRECFRL